MTGKTIVLALFLMLYGFNIISYVRMFNNPDKPVRTNSRALAVVGIIITLLFSWGAIYLAS